MIYDEICMLYVWGWCFFEMFGDDVFDVLVVMLLCMMCCVLLYVFGVVWFDGCDVIGLVDICVDEGVVKCWLIGF